MPPHTGLALPLTPNPKTFRVDGISVTAGGPTTVSAEVDVNGDGTIECSDSVALTVIEVDLKALDFASAHDPMRDNSTDFEPTGPFFEKPEWFPGWVPPRNAPISHTMDSNVVIDPIIFIQPANFADLPFRITCTGPQGFNFDEVLTLHGSLNTPSITSTDVLERKIQKLSVDLVWDVRFDGRSFLQEQTGPHTAYITMGAPRDTQDPRFVVTTNRMERAVQYADDAESVAPHEIVKTVMHTMAPDFNILVSADPEKAWNVPEDSGDCQSITRFVEKVIKQVGCPGTFDHVNIYAIETNPTDAIEDDPNCQPPGGCDCCGLNSNVREHPTNPDWWLSLVVVDGIDADDDGACNAFEATAKFTYCNKTRYYPGGSLKVYDDKDKVLNIFDTMSWVKRSGLAETPPKCRYAPIQPSAHVFEYPPEPPNSSAPNCP